LSLAAILRGRISIGLTILGSASISVQTFALQRHHPSAKQPNAGAAIHSELERRQPVDLSLHLPIAPGLTPTDT
jgi:hypothetical protein